MTKNRYEVTFVIETDAEDVGRLPWYPLIGDDVMPVDWLENPPIWQNPRENFLVAIFNRDHIGNRVEFLQKIAKYKKPHGFGEPFKNWFYGESQKLNVLSHFKFTMCFENCRFDGVISLASISAPTAFPDVRMFWMFVISIHIYICIHIDTHT